MSLGLPCGYVYIKLSKYRMICIHISVFTEIYASVKVTATAVSRGITFLGCPFISFSGMQIFFANFIQMLALASLVL